MVSKQASKASKQATEHTEEEEKVRRSLERSNRQANANGQTTMISPLARLMATSLRPTSNAAAAAAKQLVDAAILPAKESDIVIFSKSTCPRCVSAKTLLAEEKRAKENISVLELDHMFVGDDATVVVEALSTSMAAVQDYLWNLTGCRTVPRIFFRGKCIGGFDDVQELHEAGRLRSLLGGVEQPQVFAAPDLGRDGMVTLPVERVDDEDHVTVRQVVELSFPIAFTGLMVKSAVMKELALPGGFGAWIMTVGGDSVDAGRPLPSRGSIAGTLAAADPQIMRVRKRNTEEAKPVGRT